MKLDPRIEADKRPLTPFDTEKAKPFVGKNCYFANAYTSFRNLQVCTKGHMTAIDDENDMPFDMADGFGGINKFPYIIPCEWAEQKEPKHIDFEAAKNDKNFERCEIYGEELLYDTKNNIFYTSDGNIHTYLTVMAQKYYHEEQTNKGVIEKKWRAFKDHAEYKEFLNDGIIESWIKIKDKSDDKIYELMYVGGGDDKICLGNMMFSVSKLFRDFELFNECAREWQPFGVEEGEE